MDDRPNRVFRLAVAGSNPFAHTTSFELRFPSELEGAPFTLAVHDLGGRRLAMLARGNAGRGPARVSWSGTDAAGGRLTPGLYLVRLTAGGRTVEVKVVKR